MNISLINKIYLYIFYNKMDSVARSISFEPNLKTANMKQRVGIEEFIRPSSLATNFRTIYVDSEERKVLNIKNIEPSSPSFFKKNRKRDLLLSAEYCIFSKDLIVYNREF